MDNQIKIALHVDAKDNVATVFAQGVEKGDSVEVRDGQGGIELIQALSAIPYGHKIATECIRMGGDVIKYGERIGIAGEDIQKGDYVHVHNMEAARGRGDLEAAR